jgi:hypothetical protein
MRVAVQRLLHLQRQPVHIFSLRISVRPTASHPHPGRNRGQVREKQPFPELERLSGAVARPGKQWPLGGSLRYNRDTEINNSGNFAVPSSLSLNELYSDAGPIPIKAEFILLVCRMVKILFCCSADADSPLVKMVAAAAAEPAKSS